MVASAKQLGSAAFSSKDRLAASELDLQFTPFSTSWNLCIFLWLHDPNQSNFKKICQKSPGRVLPLRHQDSPLCSRDWALAVFFCNATKFSDFFALPKFRATSVAASIPLHVVCLWKLTCLLFERTTYSAPNSIVGLKPWFEKRLKSMKCLIY